MSELLTGAQILCRTLSDAGVEVLFGYPGGAIMPFYDALHGHPGLRHILVRHEQAAAHAADGYARAGSRVGVCVATSGPGATNLVTGLATAHMDGSPLLAITGQVGRHPCAPWQAPSRGWWGSEEHTAGLQARSDLGCPP